MRVPLRVPFYMATLLVLNIMMTFAPWASVYLSLIILLTYLTFRPSRALHPNNMVFAFYGLYVVMSSTLNLILDLIDWNYVLPWGQVVFWDTFSKYTLFQAEFTFLVLYFAFHIFAKDAHAQTVPAESPILVEPVVTVQPAIMQALYLFTFLLMFWFMQVTGGAQAWISDYSFTFLTGREGHGLLNIVTIVFGNITVFLLGLKFYHAYEQKRGAVLLAIIAIVFPLSYINGFKSRFIFLLLLFFAPYLMRMVLGVRRIALFAVSFLVMLYLLTLVRTEGFYASAPFFLEMLIGYFNSFQLHDYVVTSRDPALLETVGQVFTKPLQILELTNRDTEFDISVMLTKEFFPEQWDTDHATQQWPLDTELYLNYYGFYLSWVPLICYAFWVSVLYRLAILRRDFTLVPIFMMEFQRIFSTMRGTIIPWDIFIYIGQYMLIYVVCQLAIKAHRPASLESRSPILGGPLRSIHGH